MRKIYLIVLFSFNFYFLKAQNDTLPSKDSMVDIEQDCNASFFSSHEKVSSADKLMLVTKTNKIVSIKNFFATNEIGEQAKYVLADLDNDGKKELIIWNFTGCAHCCDEIYFFKNIASGKYQYARKVFAGNSCINDKNEISYDFYEQFGYFFTCYACAYEDSTETAPVPVRSITLKYKNGKLIVKAGDKELKSVIVDNLAKLSEKPYQKLNNDIDQDDGLRKEFALNLAVYYHSFGKNLIETKKLFDKYYRFLDSKKVWTQFVKTLSWIKKQNDF